MFQADSTGHWKFHCFSLYYFFCHVKWMELIWKSLARILKHHLLKSFFRVEPCFKQYTFLQYDFISTLQFSYIGSSIRTLEGNIQKFKCKLLNRMWLQNGNCSHNPPCLAAFIIQVDKAKGNRSCNLSTSSVQKKPFFFFSVIYATSDYHHSAVQKVWKQQNK